jgi:serine/threonine-protein kinase RsbW
VIIKMTLDLPAEAPFVSLCRNMTQTLLGGMDVVQEDVEDVELIVGETCANVVRHAYGDSDCRYTVEVAFAKDEVAVTVKDTGRGADLERWNAVPQDTWDHGRGLLLVRALADQFDYEVKDGTTIRAAVKLHYRSAAAEARACEMDQGPGASVGLGGGA